MNLYRKYRPQDFSDMVQQDFAVHTLKNAIITRRIAHAYIFSGPRGTGKTSLAKIYAKALNCLDETSYEPCNKCKNCIDFNDGRFLDYFEIDAASNGKVDEMRELIDKVKYVPSQGKYKIYVLDEAHMLTTGASNAFLKTLEEPPAHVIFMLATTEPHKILNTIKSRCQFFEFHRINIKNIKERLRFVCEQEKIEISEDALDYVSYYSEGGLRDALSILDQLWAFSENKIDIDVINKVFGTAGYNKIFDFIEICTDKDFKKLLEFTNKLYEQGSDFNLFVEDALKILKEILYFKWNRSGIDFMPVLREMQSRIGKLSEKCVYELLEILNREYYSIKKSEDSKIALELEFFKFFNKKDVVEVEKRKTVPRFSEKPSYTDTVMQKIEKKIIKQPNEIDELTIKNGFDIVIENIDKKSKFVASCLKLAQIKYSKEDKELKLIFDKKYSFHFKKINASIKIVKEEIESLFGSSFDINIEILEDKKKNDLKKDIIKEKEESKKEVKVEKKDNMQDIIENDQYLKEVASKIKIKSITRIEED